MAESEPEEMGAFLYDIGASLKQEPLENAVKLREGMNEISYVLEDSSNPHLQFQRYFLSTLVNDMWKNLAMSVSREVSDNDQKEVLSTLGKSLCEIGKATKNRNFNQCYQLYTDLLGKYTSRINGIEVKRI
ncbi:hypothetical protein ACFQE1_03345 [Halobium palmae]|uniref:Uncharacterized protein n=1 Tax=Halobium palmae TaxID=1776492 RepID=A0ABD5RW11_9EURY